MSTPPIDLSPYAAGSNGIPYVIGLDGSMDGPHAMITSLVHGNEICGAVALDRLLKDGLRPRRGRLTLAFVNLAAFGRYDAARPNDNRCVDEDLNRVWSDDRLSADRTSVELERARQLRPVVDTVDMLLDIHSMQTSAEPMILAGPLDKGLALARDIGAPAVIMRDQGHAAGPRLRDYGAFGDPASPRNALLVECGQHVDSAAPAVALDTVVRFLAVLDMIDAAALARYRRPDRPQRVIQVTHPVTIRSQPFRFAADYRGMEVIARQGTVIAHDGDIPVTTPYDDCVLIMPSRRLKPGETAVRLGRFVV